MLLPGTSWEIRSGENWAILGPNGSGKSALARAVRGDVPHVRGKLIRHDPEAEGSRIGYVSFELQEELLAREERREEARSFSGRGHDLTAGELLRENDGDPAALNRLADIAGPSAPPRPRLPDPLQRRDPETPDRPGAAPLSEAPDPGRSLRRSGRRQPALSGRGRHETHGGRNADPPRRPASGGGDPGDLPRAADPNGRVAQAGRREEVLTPARMRRSWQGNGKMRSLPGSACRRRDAGRRRAPPAIRSWR